MLKKKQIDTSQIHYISHDYYGYLAKYTGKRHLAYGWIFLLISIVWYLILKFNEDTITTDGPLRIWIAFLGMVALYIVGAKIFDGTPMFIAPSRYELSAPNSFNPKYLKNDVYQKAANDYFDQVLSGSPIDQDAWYKEFQSLNRIMEELPEEKKQTPKDFTSELKEYKKILEELE